MTTQSIAELLKYADIQMAAEAFFEFNPDNAATLIPGSKRAYDNIGINALTTGNNHASKFTTAQATKFAAEWSIVEHLLNTATGFSGTLFKTRPQTNSS